MAAGSIGWREAELLRDRLAAETFDAIERDRVRAPVRLRRFLVYIASHLFDPELNVERLKRALGSNDNAFSPYFSVKLGQSPARYIAGHRLAVAERLLCDTELTVSMIGQLIGYSCPAVFSAAFKRVHGEAPRIRRQRTRRAAAAPHVLSLHDQARQRARAEGAWWAIAGRPVALQKEMVRGLGLRDEAFFALLLEKSRTEGRDDRRRGVTVAELAVASLEPEGAQVVDDRAAAARQVRARICLGNANRLALDFVDAEQAFRAAQDLLQPPLDEDPSLAGDLAFNRALLRWFQKSFEEARALADRAVPLLRRSGDRQRLARALNARAVIAIDAQDLVSARPDLEEVIAMTDLRSDPQPAVSAYLSIAQMEIDGGRFDRAKAALARARRCSGSLEWAAIRAVIRWSAGQIALGTGEHAEAERLLQKARDGFIRVRDPYHAAWATIELAATLVVSGRPAAAIEAAGEALDAFDTLAIHREGAMARKILTAAIEAKALGVPALNGIRERLRHLGHDPVARYQLTARTKARVSR